MDFRKAFAAKYVFHYFLWILLIPSLALGARWLFTFNPGLFILYIVVKTSVLASIVYLNLLWLFPVFYKQKRYAAYFIIVFFIAVIAGAINMEMEDFIAPGKIFGSGKDHFFYFLSQLLMALRYILFSFFLKITVDFYLQKETLKKIELEKARAELNFLKAQVNPHFLFNTLNNLYALILENSDKSGEAVLKLADIMKYTLAESKEDKVLLQKEIQLLYNYTELERLRKPDAAVSFTVSGKTDNSFITPLLLLPLVENAFKYGLNSVVKNGFVRINIKVENKELHVTVENNIPPVKNNEAFKSLGTGIENVKRRLEILYPGKYVINIDSKAEVFFVQLKLQLA